MNYSAWVPYSEVNQESAYTKVWFVFYIKNLCLNHIKTHLFEKSSPLNLSYVNCDCFNESFWWIYYSILAFFLFEWYTQMALFSQRIMTLNYRSIFVALNNFQYHTFTIRKSHITPQWTHTPSTNNPKRRKNGFF